MYDCLLPVSESRNFPLLYIFQSQLFIVWVRLIFHKCHNFLNRHIFLSLFPTIWASNSYHLRCQLMLSNIKFEGNRKKLSVHPLQLTFQADFFSFASQISLQTKGHIFVSAYTPPLVFCCPGSSIPGLGGGEWLTATLEFRHIEWLLRLETLQTFDQSDV